MAARTEPEFPVDALVAAAPDLPPLWLPRHENLVFAGLRRTRQTAVEGVSTARQILGLLFGAPRTVLGRLGALLGTIAFLSLLPTWADGGGWGNLFRVGGYHLWTLTLLLILSAHLRSISVGRTFRHVLTGALAVVALVYFGAGPLTDIAGVGDRRVVWVVPPLEEMAKAIPLVFAVLAGRRFWRHPGLTDLVLLGFAVGAGFAFHEDALWGRVAGSGFEGPTGFIVPSLVRAGNSVVVGHAGWTALIGFAIGLLVLHRRQPVAVVGAGVITFAVIADHMSINDGRQRLGWVRDILFDGQALVVMLFLAFVTAFVLDHRRLGRVRSRDHLFGDPRPDARRERLGDPPGDSQSIRSLRYLRLRNGAHTAIVARGERDWPCASSADDHFVTALALAARDAGVPPIHQHLDGWEVDPDGNHPYRFRAAAGWTTYVSDGDSAELSTSNLRPDATAFAEPARDDTFWRSTLILTGAVIGAIVLRLLTVDDVVTPGGVDFGSLPDAPRRPPLWRTILGSPTVFPCSDLGLDDLDGPPEDPEPPEECEA